MKSTLERRLTALEDAVRLEPEQLTKFEMSILILNLLSKAHEGKADPEEHELARRVAGILGASVRERCWRQQPEVQCQERQPQDPGRSPMIGNRALHQSIIKLRDNAL